MMVQPDINPIVSGGGYYSSTVQVKVSTYGRLFSTIQIYKLVISYDSNFSDETHVVEKGYTFSNTTINREFMAKSRCKTLKHY